MVLTSGGMRLVALVMVTVAGFAVGLTFVHYQMLYSTSSAHRRLQIFGVLTGLCALYFWGWAALDSLATGNPELKFDPGVFYMIFPLSSSVSLFVWTPDVSSLRAKRRQRWAVGLAPLLPIFDYAVAMRDDEGSSSSGGAGDPLLLLFHWLGIAWWALDALAGALLLTRAFSLRSAEGMRDHLQEEAGAAPALASDAPAHALPDTPAQTAPQPPAPSPAQPPASVEEQEAAL